MVLSTHLEGKGDEALEIYWYLTQIQEPTFEPGTSRNTVTPKSIENRSPSFAVRMVLILELLHMLQQ
jgi:hypothetical protein